MSKQSWKPGNMLYPLPVVMVSAADKEGRDDIITVAWAGTVCTNPPMVSISIRPERYSYHMIRETGEFVINLTTEELAFKETGLTREKAEKVKAPMIAEAPVSIECKVKEIRELGSHHMFIAQVAAVHADEKYMDEKNRFDLNRARPIVYSHGEYLETGKKLGTFGYSVKKAKKQAKKR